MSIWSDLIKGGAEGLFTGIGTFAKDLRTAITGEAPLDPNKRAELLIQAQALEAAAVEAELNFAVRMSEAQTAINAVEAQNSRLFVSGWRPAVGWVCVSGMCYTFLLKPILPWAVGTVAALSGMQVIMPILPEVPMGDLVVLLAGMLGLGTLRTVEKSKGVNSK